MKRRQIWLAAFLIAALVGLAWLAWRPRPEPVYQGKAPDAWLDDLAAQRPTAYKEALYKIGPAAIPGIIRKLDQNDSPLRNAYRNPFTWTPSN